ncbi:hypothetical protein BATDEDRAFT_21763 [Batrachochytrium dendrobatidis JAM81]|uniref:Uncharacterized protein n=1 Tax=Batrachochytrium dendrobatidis (strain JAM81 / FGSC 10211) TaxID=684364 RepID=F4NV13_BATDJ|nr:uncharacterized protein BATDEDRAFT_21763 [Batrachochytrium dendrobatidis JAM81]EGF84071.1 hypothetical protein BATDEDRAFT_21763 [Batrachochytrium dendrobatidis JAM81]KAK5671422.1 hypothetical protein QVD99_002135 [Batrachochytrium dendrobatidis]|eukprot:XP_006675375.1 hypothetical protein BATDEDRAFT_21763 [Batrachochytrium dendrobatidis JAM81]
MTTDSELKVRQGSVVKPQPGKAPTSKLQHNLESAAWLLASGGLAYYLRPDQVMLSNTHSIWFYLSLISALAFFSVFLYLELYLPRKQGRRVNYKQWESDAPRSIQFATLFGVSTTICTNALVWGSYGAMSPLLLFIWFMGLTTIISLF